MGSVLFFSASDSTGGTELWKSDGTDAGTVRVKDINSGTGNSNPNFLTNVNGTLFFTAADLTTGNELWVLPNDTATSLSVSLASPAPVGSALTLTATVSSAPGTSTPMGTVQFLDGSSPLGSVILVNGVATLSGVTGLGVGSHTITAQYSGDGTHDPGAAATTTFVIASAATTTSLAGPTGPIAYGASATFQVTVTPEGPIPVAGSVQFQVDGAPVGGPVVLVNGTATFQTSTATGAGAHAITAIFTPSVSGLNGSQATATLQIQALKTSVIDIGYLTVPQRAMLTETQVQMLAYTQFRYLTAAQVYQLTPAQVASITSSYWISLMSPEAQAALAARKENP